MNVRTIAWAGIAVASLGCASTVDGTWGSARDAGRDVPPGVNHTGVDPFRPVDAGPILVDGSTDTGTWQLPDASVFDQRYAYLYVGSYLNAGVEGAYLLDTDDGLVRFVTVGAGGQAPRLGAPIEMGGPVQSAVVDDAGTLWAVLGGAGIVASVSAAGDLTSTRACTDGDNDCVLTTLNGATVVVDGGTATATELPRGRRISLPLSASRVLVGGDSDALALLDPAIDELALLREQRLVLLLERAQLRRRG